MHGINLKKCVACGDPITGGLFCDRHAKQVAGALTMTSSPSGVDRAKLKAEADARYAALQKAKAGKP